MSRSVTACMLMFLFISAVFRRELSELHMYGRMIADRSAEGTLVEAIQSTFSGNAPCEKCLELAQEQGTSATDSIVSRHGGLPGTWCMLSAGDPFVPPGQRQKRIPAVDVIYFSPKAQPETPPPRYLQAV